MFNYTCRRTSFFFKLILVDIGVLTIGKMVPLVYNFTNDTIGNTIGNTIGTNSTNIRQQMVQTEYSVGNSTNAGKVT